MSVRPLISMYLLMFCAVTTGCWTSSDPKAERENLDAGGRPAARGGTRLAERKAEMTDLAANRNAAAEKESTEKRAAGKRAAEDKAAADSYVKVKVDVELRGVLSYTEKAATISLGKKDKWVWVLDFGEDKGMRGKAKALDGKTVLVEGRAILRGIQTESSADKLGEFFGKSGVKTEAFLDLEPKVAVKSLVAATKE